MLTVSGTHFVAMSVIFFREILLCKGLGLGRPSLEVIKASETSRYELGEALWPFRFKRL